MRIVLFVAATIGAVAAGILLGALSVRFLVEAVCLSVTGEVCPSGKVMPPMSEFMAWVGALCGAVAGIVYGPDWAWKRYMAADNGGET